MTIVDRLGTNIMAPPQACGLADTSRSGLPEGRASITHAQAAVGVLYRWGGGHQ